MLESCTPPRRYRGTPLADRQAQRRAQLMAAAIRIYSERGYRNTSVKAVCEAASLTERYFYESFTNSEALLAACLSQVNEELLGALARVGQESGLVPQARARLVLRAYFQTLADNPSASRLFLLEIRGVSAEVDCALAQGMRHFGLGLVHLLLPPGSLVDDLLLTGVVGGILHIALHWMITDFQTPLDQVSQAAWQLCQVLTQVPEREVSEPAQ